ncbi:somatostatin receptor type 5-like [Limulus polyphemus]|uniref:Somatostatin receptor type 5-like n=1 Tax=Limulus polyphemus TaxID=6850 RepID=A0ABM1BWX1_LIMPO|nr:somatostatin receptor type 5-like [Limulus polyphemus]
MSNETEGLNETVILFNDINSSLTNETSPPEVLPGFVLELTKILYGVVCLVGLGGNSLVIYVVVRYSKMQTVTNMYLLNLALADQMFLIGLPFLIATMAYGYWPFGLVMCKLYMTSTSINQFTSSLLLAVMSADRYVAVCHPISSPRYRTSFIAKLVCFSAWTLSALLMIPIYIYANIMQSSRATTCTILWPESDYTAGGQKAFVLYSFTMGFAIPLILVLLFYFLVICRLKTIGPKKKSKEKKRSHRKVTYLVLTVITVYVICWLPYWVTQVYLSFLPPDNSGSSVGMLVFLVAGWLSYANSAVNPILYAFLSENFKKSFARAFVCAATKDFNNQLQVENSMFPKNSSRGLGRKRAHQGRAVRESKTDVEMSTGVVLVSRCSNPLGEKESLMTNGPNQIPLSTEGTQSQPQ